MRIVSTICGLVLLLCVSTAGQSHAPVTVTKPKNTDNAAIARMPDGHPDLQGTWDFAQLTPFERPDAFAGKKLDHRRRSRGVRSAAD